MIAFSFWPISIYWYGIFYIISFLLWFFYFKYIVSSKKYFNIIHQNAFLDDMLVYIVLWVLIWWRLGYVFFYNFYYFFQNPIKIFYVWEGGMAFVWAFIWVWIALYLLVWKYKISYFKITDLIISILPFGLWIWRIWNYLNWELFWKACPNFLLWTFLCRDFWLWWLNISNQLLESFFEWWLLLFVFQYLVWKKNILYNKWFLTIFFIIYYSIVRFLLEFIRYHPENYILYFWLSISQYFMIIFFIIWIYLLYRKISKKL